MGRFVKKLYRSTKKERAALLDYVAIIVVNLLSLMVLDLADNLRFDWMVYILLPFLLTGYYIIFQLLLGLNRTKWEFAISKNFVSLFIAVFFAVMCTTFTARFIFGQNYWLFTYMLVSFFGTYTFLMLMRFAYSYIFSRANRSKAKSHPLAENNTMIIGAGWTGSAIAKELLNNPDIFYPVCFLDDDFEKNDKDIMGIPVAGHTNDIEKIVEKYKIKKIIFAIPTCEKEKRKQILKACVDTRCELKVVPPIYELINKSDVIPQTRDVRIEDLLGREPFAFDKSEVRQFVTGKVCLVTGGGGSIGSELCRQIASFDPKKLIILDIYENNAYDIQQELKLAYGNELDLDVEICSIADYDKCRVLFKRFKPDLVFHAAAHKHVPLMETVPEQAVKNNIVGTYNLCKLAAEFGVKKFLLISTDKAVNPTNVMGASKRTCEMIVQYHAQTCPKTVFCAVRFGNVLGSNGSVIPLFKKQIAAGGPVTITDERIIRYFMTIPEAVSLVLETGALSQSGEIFVLDMGEPVKILDLAENMIRLSGLEVGKDIEIKFTGLRPGEKLYEELLLSGEGMRKTSNRKIFICKQVDVDGDKFVPQLKQLIAVAKANDPDAVLDMFKKIVPTFKHQVGDAKAVEEMPEQYAKIATKPSRTKNAAAHEVVVAKQKLDKPVEKDEVKPTVNPENTSKNAVRVAKSPVVSGNKKNAPAKKVNPAVAANANKSSVKPNLYN